MKNNINYILSIIAFLISMYNWYYSIKTAKKLRKINEEFTNIYIENEIKENKFNMSSDIDEAHKKYSNKSKVIEYEVKNPIKEYINNPNLGKIIYSDEKTVLVELQDGTRFMLDKKYSK